MQALYLYLFKLSVSLSVVYLFYQFALKRLTFYNWNRFFLLCYTMLSFLIPFINITPVLERNEMTNNGIVKFIPAVDAFGSNNNANILSVKLNAGFAWTVHDWILAVFATGFCIMLVRLFILLLSFKRIVNKAELILDEDVKLYQVNQSIIPFSFGKSIFINRGLHNEDELEEIVRHEFVHVRQHHTADIIWAELLCILNWYNPFVWLTRKAIRQNLEFIADNKVLQTGIDRKHYQYLLLKVIGNNHLSIASQFNFSSLKKRIAMMNKTKSAKAHLIKFLFVLPLIAIMILSFRNKMSDKRSGTGTTQKVFNLSGIIYDNKTELPLPGVRMVETATGVETRTDDNGYYKLTIPVAANEKQQFDVKFSKEGYGDNDRRIELVAYTDRSCLGFFSLLKDDNAGEEINHAYFYSAKDENGNAIANPGYVFVKDRFENYFKQRTKDESFYEEGIHSLEDVKIEVIKTADTDTVPGQAKVNSKGYFVDITGDKENGIVVVKDKNQKEIKRLLLTEWYRNSNRYEYLYGSLPANPKDEDSVVNPDKLPATYDIDDETAVKDFKRLELNDDLIATITLNTGKIAKYDLNKEKDKKAFEKKYGPVISALPKGRKPVQVIKSTVSYSSPEIAGVSSSAKTADVYIAVSPDKTSSVGTNNEPSEPGSPVRGFDNVNGDIILDIKGNMPENKVNDMVAELKNKGYDVAISALEYRNGKIALFKGAISANGRKKNFEASDFLRFVISDIKADDGKKDFNFYIGSGSLVWQ